MKIVVPATSANLGPGFDSCGLALSEYLVVEVIGQSDRWKIHHDLGVEIPEDETNLLLKTALEIAPDLPPYELKMDSTIPLARGLGSSSSVIVAGIELANQLANLHLTNQDKLCIATKIEGHPDNVAPAIFGDLVISTTIQNEKKLEVYAVKQSFPECGIIAYIPNNELLTRESREVLPMSFDYKEAVQASSIANVMVAALLSNDIKLAGNLMAKDKFHEPYRAKLVPHLQDIKVISEELEAYGVFLSGAGPTVLILIDDSLITQLTSKLEEYAGSAAKVLQLKIDRQGVRVHA